RRYRLGRRRRRLIGGSLLEPADIVVENGVEPVLHLEETRERQGPAAGNVGRRECVAQQIRLAFQRLDERRRFTDKGVDRKLRAPILLFLVRREETGAESDVERSRERCLAE